MRHVSLCPLQGLFGAALLAFLCPLLVTLLFKTSPVVLLKDIRSQRNTMWGMSLLQAQALSPIPGDESTDAEQASVKGSSQNHGSSGGYAATRAWLDPDSASAGARFPGS